MRGCEDLFEALQVSLGLQYISDLNNLTPYHRKQLRFVLQAHDLEVYPLSQWNEIIRYITGKENPQQTISDAIAVLTKYSES